MVTLCESDGGGGCPLFLALGAGIISPPFLTPSIVGAVARLSGGLSLGEGQLPDHSGMEAYGTGAASTASDDGDPGGGCLFLGLCLFPDHSEEPHSPLPSLRLSAGGLLWRLCACPPTHLASLDLLWHVCFNL